MIVFSEFALSLMTTQPRPPHTFSLMRKGFTLGSGYYEQAWVLKYFLTPTGQCSWLEDPRNSTLSLCLVVAKKFYESKKEHSNGRSRVHDAPCVSLKSSPLSPEYSTAMRTRQ